MQCSVRAQPHKWRGAIALGAAATVWFLIFHKNVDAWNTFGTGVIAAATLWLARVTVRLAQSTVEEGRRSTGLQIFQQQVQAYQEEGMRKLRKHIAHDLILYKDRTVAFSLHRGDATVIDFFENLGRLIKADAIDSQLAWNYFADAALCTWESINDSVLKIRHEKGHEDLYVEFEWLRDKFARMTQDEKDRTEPEYPTERVVRDFLESEMALTVFQGK